MSHEINVRGGAAKQRVHFTAWGAAEQCGVGDGYAVRAYDDEPAIQAVTRSLERRSGLVACAGPMGEGTALDRHGKPTARHYSLTLGRPVRGGGYAPVGQVWVAIKVTPS